MKTHDSHLNIVYSNIGSGEFRGFVSKNHLISGLVTVSWIQKTEEGFYPRVKTLLRMVSAKCAFSSIEAAKVWVRKVWYFDANKKIRKGKKSCTKPRKPEEFSASSRKLMVTVL